jgi:phosphosulfolactate phosphohydrolase-like enzyme
MDEPEVAQGYGWDFYVSPTDALAGVGEGDEIVMPSSDGITRHLCVQSIEHIDKRTIKITTTSLS